ncbi:MAG: hypothetical protein KKC18_10615 [Chloroflexi bacterium]|nr:hypothetical protein [Chloroflexota bacterium]
MAKVLTYSNSGVTCFSTIGLDSGENIFISIAGKPTPSIVVSKSRLLGLMNTTIWRFTPEMAGGSAAYAQKLMLALAGAGPAPKHPLDAIVELVMSCRSAEEVRGKLHELELRMNAQVPTDT